MDKELDCRSTQLPVTHRAKTLTHCDYNLTQTPILTLTSTMTTSLILTSKWP